MSNHLAEQETEVDGIALNYKLAGEERPLLILHGSNDEVAPVADAYALYDAAAEPKHLEILAGSDHAFTRDRDLEKVIDLSLRWFQRYL